MRKEEILEKFIDSAIIPVVVIEDGEDAVGLGKALLRAGIRVIEITLRTPAGVEAIRKMREHGLDMCIGAGTVLSAEMAEKAVKAGASFLVSPGIDEEVVGWALKNDVLMFPGAATPSEFMRAMKLGIDVIKFFPAEDMGGVKLLKALKGPFPNLRFIPTGGINADNIAEYMAVSGVVSCGGSWICPSKLIREHRFDEITELCREAVKRIRLR